MKRKVFLPLVVLSLFLLLFYLVYRSPRVQSVVEGRIYRSPKLSANFLEKTIKEKGIKTIINLRGENKESKWYIEQSEICKKNNIKLYDCRLHAADLPKYPILMKILDILYTSERPLLIQCAAGVDRTGFASALALAIEKDVPLFELKRQFSLRYGSVPFIRTIGPLFFPNMNNGLIKCSGPTPKRI